MKDNYIVAQIGEEPPITYTKVAGNFESTRIAVKWVREYGEDEIPYAVLKITKTVEVETISRKRVLELQ